MTNIIGIKELHRNLKNISEETQKGTVFIVVKYGKPIFEIKPFKQEVNKKYALADLKKLRFKTSDKNLSKNIDKTLYS